MYIVHLKAYTNNLPGVQVMATINLQCNAFSKTFQCLLQAENSMTGRGNMGEALMQVWLESIKKY